MKRITEYRNIVFDMGGVLVDYTADNATWHFTDDPEIVREIHNVMFCSQEWMALDMGSISCLPEIFKASVPCEKQS